MPGRIEKTVFISYRRTNLPWALFVYQNLTMHGYDVFFDYQSIDNGNVERVILDNIRARAHFIVVLTPSALENCNKPGDWLRREIETAMEENRNIVPLMVENFDFGSTLVKEALTGKLSALSNYNGLSVPNAYALEAMDRLRERYLNKTLSDVPTPVLHLEAQQITDTQKAAASEAAPVNEDQLTAQSWFERGYVFAGSGNFSEAIRCFTTAIRIDKDFTEAFVNRGLSFWGSGNFEDATNDFNQAIHLNPTSVLAYYGRGLVRGERKDKRSLKGSLADFNKAIHLDPDFAGAYIGRGITQFKNGDFDLALLDFNKALEFTPSSTESSYLSFKYRGNVHYAKDEFNDAVSDYSKAIKLAPRNPHTYLLRAVAWAAEGNFPKSSADYRKYLAFGGGTGDQLQKELEKFLQDKASEPTKKKSTRKSSK
jgi:tetratricopeptide (TPR) repeat protein